MGKFKSMLLVVFISLFMIVSACGKDVNQSEEEQVTEETSEETEESVEQDDEDELDVTEDEEVERNDDKKATEEVEQESESTKVESTRTTAKKETASSKQVSNEKKSSKSDNNKIKKDTSSSSQSKGSPKKSTTNQSTTKNPPQKKEPKEEKVEQTVTVAVSVPSGVNGKGLSATKVTINDGDTVLDASLKTSAQINYSGSGATAYIKGINGLNEFDEGPMSGWQVKVDGALINRSAGSFEVKPNQKVEWVYTTDYSN